MIITTTGNFLPRIVMKLIEFINLFRIMFMIRIDTEKVVYTFLTDTQEGLSPCSAGFQ